MSRPATTVPIAPPGVAEAVAKSTKAAETFVQRYYAATDSAPADRANRVAPFYTSASRISWNGNPLPAMDLHAFLGAMPKSVHEVQAFDCHPISGSAANGTPSLVVSVTGQVTHGDAAPPSTGVIHSKDYDWLPRVFNQSFILVIDSANAVGGTEPSYVIASDAFRFC